MENLNFNKEEKDLEVEKLIESIEKDNQEELKETQEIDEESIKLEVQANLDNVRKNLNSISAETDDQHISELDISLLEKKVEKLTKRSISYLQDIFDMDSKNKTDKKSAYKTVVNTLKNTFRENGDKTNLIDDIINGLDLEKGNHKKIIAELFEKVLDSKISLEGLGYIGDIDMNFETDEYIDGDVFEQRLKLSQKNLLNDNEYNAKTGEYDAISQISDKIGTDYDKMSSEEFIDFMRNNTYQSNKFDGNYRRYRENLSNIGRDREKIISWWLDQQLGVDLLPYKVLDEDTYELMKNTVLLDITTIDPDKNMSEDSLKQFEQKYRGTPEQVLEKKIKNQNSNRKIYQKLFGNGIAPTVLVIDVNTNKIFEDQLIDEKSNKIKSYPSLENLIISAKKISNLPNNEVPNYIKLSELKMVDDLDLDTYIDYVDDTNSWKNRVRSSSTNSTVTTERSVSERPTPTERPTLPNRVVEIPKRSYR